MRKSYKVDNAIIMAAGVSSRFAPLSYEYPKALLVVKGEVLIERQIRQLQEAGIKDITVVVGYKKEMLNYLKDKFDVDLIENPEFQTRNNHSTLYYVKEKMKNTYICSADNYFFENVFKQEEEMPFYSLVYVAGETDEWCLSYDKAGLITNCSIGGKDSWIMLGHIFMSEEFSKSFLEILEEVYNKEETKNKLWEKIYIENLDKLSLYIKKYNDGIIFEFDTLDELRQFDATYIDDTPSLILDDVAIKLNDLKSEIINCKPLLNQNEVIGFSFVYKKQQYHYYYDNCTLERI